MSVVTLTDPKVVVTVSNLRGPQGVAGADGAQGIQGIQGEQGIQGIQGIQGLPGDDQFTFDSVTGTFVATIEQSTSVAVGQDLMYRVRNDGIALTRGQLVYASNAAGHRVIVKPANAASVGQAAGTLGFVTSSLALNTDGYVLSHGVFSNMNTTQDSEGNALSVGDILYLSATVTGGFTKIKPTTARRVGSVLDVHPTQGKILVELPPSMSVGEISDVQISLPSSGEVLRYDGSKWANARVAPTTIEYDDVQVPSTQFGVGDSAPDMIAFGPVTSMLAPGFDGGGLIEQIFGQVELPHSYKEGTDIIPHVHWVPSTTGTGVVRWQMAYSIANVNSTFATQATLAANSSVSNERWKNKVVGLGSISGVGVGISAIIAFRLWRDPTNVNDTYGDDAILMSVGFHYQKDSFGSRQEFIK